jgi:hypothetical protein
MEALNGSDYFGMRYHNEGFSEGVTASALVASSANVLLISSGNPANTKLFTTWGLFSNVSPVRSRGFEVRQAEK